MLFIFIAFVLMGYWTYQDAVKVFDFFELPSTGQALEAQVSGTGTWFVTIWPYRIKYRFQHNGQFYNQPFFKSYRARDVGSPVPADLMSKAEKRGYINIFYHPEYPERNTPAISGKWRIYYAVERIWSLVFKLDILTLLLFAVMFVYSGGESTQNKSMQRAVAIATGFSVGGYILLTTFIRLVHVFTGSESMGLSDMALNLFVAAVWLAIPFTVAKRLVARYRE